MINKSSSLGLENQGDLNSFVGSLFIEVLARLGVDLIVSSPGSRSTPLVKAAADNPKIKLLTFLDERSAAFAALGYSKANQNPAVLISTSGTAAANYYPAIIEAKMSSIPLIIVTCDRPYELRDRSAGQTIDQTKLYGSYAKAFYEVGLPENNFNYFDYLRQTVLYGYSISVKKSKGPVHFNFPFREPLTQITQLDIPEYKSLLDEFSTVICKLSELQSFDASIDDLLIEKLKSHSNGLIIIGDAQNIINDNEDIKLINDISEKLGWPILSDVINPVRNYSSSINYLISSYDLILSDERCYKDFDAKAILQIGSLPTSKVLRSWLKSIKSFHFIISNDSYNKDSLNNFSIHLNCSLSSLSNSLDTYSHNKNWINIWTNAERSASNHIENSLQLVSNDFEGKVTYALSKCVPNDHQVILANSMSVRYAEYFWMQNNSKAKMFCNRGTNGIDGIISSAIGISINNKPSILLAGDLAFIYDSNGLLNHRMLNADILILVINNNGGGIFENLSISKDPNFESHWATPQDFSIKQFCKSISLNYTNVNSLDSLDKIVKNIKGNGIHVAEIVTDRKKDSKVLKEIYNKYKN